MRKLHDKVKAAHDAGVKGGEEHQYRATKFFVAEAELLLLDARAQKDQMP
jgi:hypothetical protein